MYGEAANRCSIELDLAGVDADSYVEAESAGVVADRETTANGTGRAVEDGEEAVACDVDLAPAKASQQGSDAPVVRCDQVSPCPVAHPCSGLGRGDDVREEDGRQHTVEVHLGAVRSGEEPFDGIEELVLIAGEREVVGSRELKQSRPGDICREMARTLDRLLPIVDAMRDQHGHLDRGEAKPGTYTRSNGPSPKTW